jgi:hypothetical protein
MMMTWFVVAYEIYINVNLDENEDEKYIHIIDL